MPRKVRLAPGVSARPFQPRFASAAGAIVCSVAVSGVAGATSSVGSISSSISVSGAGASIASAAGDILCRVSAVTGVGQSINSAVGNIPVTVSVNGRSNTRYVRLGLRPGPIGYKPTPNKGTVVERLWFVTDSLVAGLTITDFNEREFFISDTLSVNLQPSVVKDGGVGNVQVTVTVNGVSKSIFSAVGNIPVTVDVQGAGAGVITQSGAGTINNTVSVQGQGSTAGSVFGAGVGLIQNAVNVQGQAASIFAAAGLVQSLVTVQGATLTVVQAAGNIQVQVTVQGFNTLFAQGVGNIPVTVTVNGVAVAVIASAGLIESHVEVLGASPFRIPVRVRAYRAGYIYDVYRNVGDIFSITLPSEYNPYFMIFMDQPPFIWLPFIGAYDREIDNQVIRFPGRDEIRFFSTGEESGD